MNIVKKLSLIVTLTASFSVFSFDADLELGIFQLNRGDFKAAIAEFKPLLAEEYAPAQYQMALMHLNGWGVKKSPQKAFELLSLSASQNYPDALFSLAVMYDEGKVVKKDLKVAFTLMEKAAKKKLPSAQFNLGVMYAQGQGTSINSAKAVSWYEKAARQNYALAQYNLALMYFEGKGVKKSTEMSYVWNIIAAKSGYGPAIKSRDMDEHKLSIDDIKTNRERAAVLYEQILVQVDLRTKMLTEKRF